MSKLGTKPFMISTLGLDMAGIYSTRMNNIFDYIVTSFSVEIALDSLSSHNYFSFEIMDIFVSLGIL